MNINKEILDEMTTLLSCDLSTYPYERFQKLYKDIEWITFDLAILQPDDIIIRARKNNDSSEFNEVKEISYKPQNLNTTFQRASSPNNTMFYGCMIPYNHTNEEFDNALLAALFEIIDIENYSTYDNLINEKVIFGIWKVDSYVPLPVIMTLKDFYSGKAQCNFPESRTWLIMPDEKEEKQINAITQFLHHNFTKRVKHNFEYIPSAMFTEYLLLKGYEGIYYPGIKSEFDSFNVALSPNCVDKKLKLDYAFNAIVHMRNGNSLIEGAYTAKQENGKLIYNNVNSKKFQSEKEIIEIFNKFEKEKMNNNS